MKPVIQSQGKRRRMPRPRPTPKDGE